MMITFIAKRANGSISRLLSVTGEVRLDTKKEFMFKKEHPFIPGRQYSYIPFFSEMVEVTFVANNETTERLRDMLSGFTESFYLQWRCGNTVHTRKLNVSELPEPVSLIHSQRITFELKYYELPGRFNIQQLTRLRLPGRSLLIEV